MKIKIFFYGSYVFCTINTQSMSNYFRFVSPKIVLLFGVGAGMAYLTWLSYKGVKNMSTPRYKNLIDQERQEVEPKTPTRLYYQSVRRENVPIELQKGYVPEELIAKSLLKE